MRMLVKQNRGIASLRTLLPAGVAFIVLFSAAVGCGGSSEAEPLQKKAFLGQANAICRNSEAEREVHMRAVATESADANPSEEAKVGTEALVAPVKTMTDELSGLGAPRGDAKQVAAIIDAFEAGVAKLEADPGGPNSAFVFTRANELSAEYGLSACTI